MAVIEDEEPSPQPWHNRTPAVVGASAVGVAIIAVVVGVISLVTGPSDPPADTPLNLVEPSFSSTVARTTTTTATITSTPALSTTEINAPLAPTTSGAPDSSESTASSVEEEEEEEDEDEEEDGPMIRKPRRTPRTNVTRTLPPRPIG
jgi:hypothetical protein